MTEQPRAHRGAGVAGLTREAQKEPDRGRGRRRHMRQLCVTDAIPPFTAARVLVALLEKWSGVNDTHHRALLGVDEDSLVSELTPLTFDSSQPPEGRICPPS